MKDLLLAIKRKNIIVTLLDGELKLDVPRGIDVHDIVHKSGQGSKN
jgi:hypothetical protein